MTALKRKKRRGAATQLADHAEPCEMRVLLSGIAIYPAQAVTSEAAPVEPAASVSSLDLTPSDYNGTWDAGSNILINLSVKGSNPEKAKVKGTVVTSAFIGGSVKLKGKISNGIELNGKFKGKVKEGPGTAKVKEEISIQLTDSTHFEGTATATIDGTSQAPTPISGVKVNTP